VFSTHPFPFVYTFKETPVLPEVLRRLRVKNEVTAWLRAQAAKLCYIGMQKLVLRINKCLDKIGDCVEK
jgi:hypothetical protein